MTVVPNPRPRASLGRVLDDLGATLLDLVHGSAERVDEISGVVIHDPVDAPVLAPSALVLGVGVEEPEHVVALLDEPGKARAAGLVLRAPVPATPEVRAAVDAAGVALLGLSRGAPWAHLAAMLRSLLAEGDVRVADEETLGGLPSGDSSPSPTPSPRCSTRRSPSRTAARGCSPSPGARTRPTRRGSRRSSAARCPSATRGSSTSVGCSASSTAPTSRSSSRRSPTRATRSPCLA